MNSNPQFPPASSHRKKISLFVRAFSILMLLAFLNLELGCNYYRVRKIEDLNAELSKQNLETQQKANKYIIVYKNGVAYHLFNIQVDQDRQILKSSIEAAPPAHAMYNPGIHTNK